MLMEINWMDFNNDTIENAYPELFKVLNDFMQERGFKTKVKPFTYIVNILCLVKESVKKNKDPRFFCEIKEKHKIMSSTLELSITNVSTTENKEFHPEIIIVPKNISAPNIIKWCPMYQALPINYC